MHPMRRSLVSPVLVGRDAELAALTAALDDAVEGVPGVVLLGGEAGVGKTRLVEEAAQRAQAAGARVLTGSCVELGGEGLPTSSSAPPGTSSRACCRSSTRTRRRARRARHGCSRWSSASSSGWRSTGR
jgi:hypothetical protein